VAIIYNLKLV
jgi:hypothetical protein